MWLTISGTAAGAEAQVLERQIARFEALHPGVRVRSEPVPEAAEGRHQLYVQWLHAGVGEPDILQLDIVWLEEFAAAGWLSPFNLPPAELADFWPAARKAAQFQGELMALPWFVDVGMLYYRKDWFATPPRTLDELVAQAERARRELGFEYGLVFQGARYEGLVAVFLEYLGGFGGRVLSPAGKIEIDSGAALAALSLMYSSIHEARAVPTAVLNFQEEQARLAFQNGQAAFMRNWPYAYALLEQAPESRVRGRFGVTAMPANPAGAATATLGGQLLAVNRHTARPELARELVQFLTETEQMLERAEVAGQLPARRSAFADPRFAQAVPFDVDAIQAIVERAVARPATPIYTELSRALQRELHRALTRQVTPKQALTAAAAELGALLQRSGLAPGASPAHRFARLGCVAFAAMGLSGLGVALGCWLHARKRAAAGSKNQERASLAAPLGLLLPALAVLASVAILPLLWAFWESLHQHDLRRPWLGRPFVGLGNYFEVLASLHFWGALGRTLAFSGLSVTLELGLGLSLALLLNRAFRGRGLLRAVALLPWATPTVIAALAFRFLFDAKVGVSNLLATAFGLAEPGTNWLSHEVLAWVPIVLADVWKTTPFVALLLLAGLQNINGELYEAAAVDGAGPVRRLFAVTLPGLRAALLVTVIFRTLDALRVFDLIYVLTQGGPGTATEPLALYTFAVLFENLEFGLGAALSVLIFALTSSLSFLYIRSLGDPLRKEG